MASAYASAAAALGAAGVERRIDVDQVEGALGQRLQHGGFSPSTRRSSSSGAPATTSPPQDPQRGRVEVAVEACRVRRDVQGERTVPRSAADAVPPATPPARPPGRARRRRLRAGALLALAVLLGVRGAHVRAGGPTPSAACAPARPGQGIDPLRYDPRARRRSRRGRRRGWPTSSTPSRPGGAVATPRRMARWRPLVEPRRAARAWTPTTLEAIVFLESAGRPDAQAWTDLARRRRPDADPRRDRRGTCWACTSTSPASARARPARIAARARGSPRAEARAAPRRPALRPAQGAGRDRPLPDARPARRSAATTWRSTATTWASATCSSALAAYGADRDPLRAALLRLHAAAPPGGVARARGLGDDSSTYLWRVRAARGIMRAYRARPGAALARHGGTCRPAASLGRGGPAPAREHASLRRRRRVRATRDATAGPSPSDPRGAGAASACASTRAMGELAAAAGGDRRHLPRAAPGRSRCCATSAPGRGRSRRRTAGSVTSTARDTRYQRAWPGTTRRPRTRSPLHTTGWAFDISRALRLAARRPQAFQFLLDRLTALT